VKRTERNRAHFKTLKGKEKLAMKGCVLLMVMAICAHADEEPVETISSLVTDSMWDCLLERVDRYILPVMPFWYEELEPVFMEPAVTAHHMGEHNVIKSFLNVRLREWREKVWSLLVQHWK
jgi:hypothetical protein